LYTLNLKTIFGPDGLIAQHLPGYEFRPQQREAALGIARALASKKHCIVEAGTGVGKSLAYLLPAIGHAQSGKKVVISTHTLYLQSQLMTKDIPFLQQIFPDLRMKTALMKGRSNYLCLNSFDAELSQLSLIGDPNISRLQRWSLETETGDVSELDFNFSGWSDICANQDRCRRNQCRWFYKCFYYKMRKLGAEADIIVTNHSLFLNDLAIRTADSNSGILPDYSAVIFDEAHHIEDVATKVFGVECNMHEVPGLVARIRRTRDMTLNPQRIQAMEEMNDRLFSAFTGSRKPEFFFSDVHDQENLEQVQGIASSLSSVLDGLHAELADKDTTGAPELADRIDGLQRMCERLRDQITEIFFGPAEGHFRWGERFAGHKSSNCYLRYTPLSVAGILRDLLWDQVDTAVLTSATLTSSGKFSYIKGRLGLTQCVEIMEDSPFDFQSQCLLYIPKNLEFPSEKPAYADSVADEIESIVRSSDGRAFLLFTSYRMMNAVFERLIGRLPYVMLKQGDMSNELLVEEFLKNTQACLFGVHSFWEGVDVRGEALSCVVIDKLPFAAPDTPTNRARVDMITEEGGDWFTQYSMPQAQMRLKQGFGRLIRTSKDRGVVAILDSRLLKKMYGREFLRFLPQCPITHRIEDVRAFFLETE